MNTNNTTNKNDIKSTSKQMLYDLLAGQGCSTTPFQRELVKLVLAHRGTKQKCYVTHLTVTILSIVRLHTLNIRLFSLDNGRKSNSLASYRVL